MLGNITPRVARRRTGDGAAAAALAKALFDGAAATLAKAHGQRMQAWHAAASRMPPHLRVQWCISLGCAANPNK